MRLFVALDLDEPVRAAIRRLLDAIRSAAPEARWVRPEAMHLTLKFIGDQPEDKLPGLRRALEAIRSPAPVSLRFTGLGYFPNDRRPRVVWLGVEASENLAGLAADVEAALQPLGIAREKRPYVPHLTLARFGEPRPAPRLLEAVAALASTDAGRGEAREFYLFQSKLSPRGAVYTKITTFPFVHG
jgi:2'-5' RNA ligase